MSKESERLTRQQRIDPKLEGSGWAVVPFAGVEPTSYSKAAVEEFETNNGPADYALCDEGRVMGVVGSEEVAPRPAGCPCPGGAIRQGHRPRSPLVRNLAQRLP